MAEKTNDLMEKIVSLCKRRGFVFPGSEIYGGLSGTWDYGPYGVFLKDNIRQIWWKRFVLDREDIFPVDAAILMNQKVWQASGHTSGFADPLIACEKCENKFRGDQLNDKTKCPECGGKLGEERKFNMMFETHVGAEKGEKAVSYLRPETAQGMFVNFKNVADSIHPKLPFGLAQIGKAFRNEIAPRDFTFRAREFEQMEIEYFVKPDSWKESFEYFRKEILEFLADIGLVQKEVHELEVSKGDLAHYSKRTIDFEYDFPFGRKELLGLAYRTDFDLKSHAEISKEDLSYLNEETKEKFIPHVIEPSFGLDRAVLAVLVSAYTEDELSGDKRVFMKFSPKVAPISVAVFPLLRNKPELVKKAREIYSSLKKEFGRVEFDDNGNIGKRYRRQDEIGTPYCVTVDFDTLEKEDVTVRDRDTGKQERVVTANLIETLSRKLK